MPDAVYNLYNAKTHLSKLVERAANGEVILIAKAGKPLARLVPLHKVKIKRQWIWPSVLRRAKKSVSYPSFVLTCSIS